MSQTMVRGTSVCVGLFVALLTASLVSVLFGIEDTALIMVMVGSVASAMSLEVHVRLSRNLAK
jgi:putative effector of murein hydrolase